uniref:Uncharacterized protein n=1 Tax=Romanomermis culicivorax TaxID=13658 RepID=A0A915J0Y1_ROMCU
MILTKNKNNVKVNDDNPNKENKEQSVLAQRFFVKNRFCEKNSGDQCFFLCTDINAAWHKGLLGEFIIYVS